MKRAITIQRIFPISDPHYQRRELQLRHDTGTRSKDSTRELIIKNSAKFIDHYKYLSNFVFSEYSNKNIGL